MGKFRHNPQDQATPGSNKLWIYNPWLDLIVGCGAWSAPLLALAYFSLASSTRVWSLAFYALALFFNYPHYMATLYRAYHRAEDFHKYRVFTVHITALVLLTLVASHFWLRILPWIFTLYLTWSPWHYSGQNYGLFMMFARRAGAAPDKITQRSLYGAFIASYLILFLGFHTGPSSDPLFVSLGIPAVVSRWEQIALGVVFMVLSSVGLSRLARETGWKKLTPSLTLFSSQFLWFLLPAAISLARGLEIPQNRYSTGVLAVMHSAQYLWITSYYARREAAREDSSAGGQMHNWRPLAYFGALIIGGIALFVPGPWLASRAFHHDFTSSFLIFTALVNIHHFILDGAIWKLRDSSIGALLVNSRVRISDAAVETGVRFAAAGRWLVGSTAGARFLRVSAALLLLAWGTIDQARYYLALRGDDLRDLQRAAALNAYDSLVETRLGHRAMEEGQLPEAEAAWRRAIRINPSDPAPRQQLLQFLIDQNRYDEAYVLTAASLKYRPKDPNLLVDRGLLALKLGHADEAVADFDRAITADPDQINAHFYLASELDREDKAQAAAAHYRSYLEKVAQGRPEDRPAPAQVIAVILRMADCQTRLSQIDRAVRSYQLAEKLAAQTGQAKLASVADVDEAALQVKAGRFRDAMLLYQHALKLDDAIHDSSASAQDWFSFSRFLDEAGFSPRLAYACLVKSRQITQSLPNTAVPESLTEAKKQLERRLGAAAAAVRRDPEPLLNEALALHP